MKKIQKFGILKKGAKLQEKNILSKIKERTYCKQTFNQRELNLCEH